MLIRRRPIGEHTGRELAALARWVESGGSNRAEADVAAEIATELDVLHHGQRTDDVLIHAVRVARAGAPQLG
jgi:rRNA-processing protein FCF1